MINGYLFSAGVLTILLAIGHSLRGERLIFKPLRKKIKGNGLKDMSIADVAILWSTWHIVSLFALVPAVAFIKIAYFTYNEVNELSNLIVKITTWIMVVASLIILIKTKGKHPAWVILLVIAILSFLGYYL